MLGLTSNAVLKRSGYVIACVLRKLSQRGVDGGKSASI